MALRDVRPTSVTLNLDKPRSLVFDLNAFAALEDVYGSMDAAFKAMQAGSMKAARTLLWAGLLHGDETLTERQVGGLVTMENMSAVMDGVSAALMEAMPGDVDEAAPEAAPADPT